MAKIVWDAGHGINTPGKRTPDGEREWTYNDKVVRSGMAFLNGYEGVQQLRVDDSTGRTDTPLAARVNQANSFKADVFISVHHNAFTGRWGSHTGTETYVMEPASKNPGSVKLANAVHPKLVQAMGLANRGIKAANFAVLRETNMPAILTEGGYMDSTIDIKRMRSDAVLKAAGEAIGSGVVEYFGLKPKQAQAAAEMPKTDKEGKELMNIPQWQREELARIYKHAREKGVFTDEKHEKHILDGTMTVQQAVVLQTIISGASLNDGKRII